jgi:hypothetical protein
MPRRSVYLSDSQDETITQVMHLTGRPRSAVIRDVIDDGFAARRDRARRAGGKGHDAKRQGRSRDSSS